MHVVVIHGWKEETTELVQTLAGALGIMAYEMRQRMIGGGPAVVANFADPQKARTLSDKLNRNGVETMIIDSDAVRSNTGRFVVRRFEIKDKAMQIETGDGQCIGIDYEDIDLFLPATLVTGQAETIKVTERKFSLGRTILSGGIPMTKKVERREEVSSEERENLLCLCTQERPAIIFSQTGMSYDGLGAAMKLSRELNFAHLKSELRRLCLSAIYDDRLLNRLGQVRLLGPALNPETNLDLAFHILSRSLRRR